MKNHRFFELGFLSSPIICLDTTASSNTLSNTSKALSEALRNLMNAVASVDPTKQAITQATKVNLSLFIHE
jgi:hypothetical protein